MCVPVSGTILGAIRESVKTGQADNIFINLDNNKGLEIVDVERWVQQTPVKGLNQLFVYKDGRLVKVQ